MESFVSRIALLAIAIGCAILGVAVYQRARDRVWNQVFAAHAAAVTAWVLVNYFIQTAGNLAQADVFVRLTHPTTALAITTLVDLFWVFPEETRFAPWRRRTLLYLSGLLFSLTALSPDLFANLELGQGWVIVEYGWPFYLFGPYVAGILIYADLVILRKLPRLSASERAQVKYVLPGIVITQVIGIITMIVLPVWFHTTYYSRWGSAAYIFVIAFTGYAIAKHRLVRPVVAALHAASYACTGVLLLGASGAAVALIRWTFPATSSLVDLSLGPLLTYLGLGLVLGAAAPTVHARVRMVLEARIAGPEPSGAPSISDGILRTLDMQELPEFLATALERVLRPTFTAVYWRHRGSEVLGRRVGPVVSLGPRGVPLPNALPLDCALAQAARVERTLIERTVVRRFFSLERAEPLVEAMDALDAEMVAPVLWEDELAGLIIIGEKLSGDIYGPEDTAILQNMLPQVSLAVRNAQLYDEVVRMKEYSEKILREMKSGVIAVDPDRRITVVNPAAEQMLGQRASLLVGRDLEILPQTIARSLLQVLAGIPARGEDRFQVMHADGQRVPLSCRSSVWRGGGQSLEGAVAVLSDLTLVEELARERQEAEHLALIRVLSAGMAHELRNPLVAIRTFSELLPVRWDEPDFRNEFQQVAKEEIDRIERLLTDLLMLSKPADAVVEPMDINAVCEGVVRALSALADARRVKLLTHLTVARGTPLGDKSRLHQALVNVMKNAIEHESAGGRVELATSLIAGEDDRGRILVTIYNPSSVIPEDQLESIFKPFYSKRPGGTGLGLAICQTIIEEHRGTITVTSRQAQGTEFAIELPINAGDREYAHGRAAGL